MGSVRLLDCTLRDGGYVNNWNFGKDAILEFVSLINDTNVEIVEVGFIRDVPYNENISVFSSMDQVKKVIGVKKTGVQYAVMAEISNPIPLDMVEPYDGEGPDIVRVICWKSRRTPEGQVVDALYDSFEYCKGFVEKGYKLCVQPNRTDQYTDEEFIAMLKLFAKLDPMAIYVVDSWGTMYSDHVLHYMHLADQILPKHIAIGYHGHNNMMQAFANAEAIIKEGFERDIIIDASIYGIGRGAGNLNLELFAKYLNDRYKKEYDITPILKVFDDIISPIYHNKCWGYSFSYYLTASENINPDYASFFSEEMCSLTNQRKLLVNMSEEEKLIFSSTKATSILKNVSKCIHVVCFTEDDSANVLKLLDAYDLSKTKAFVDISICNFGDGEETKEVVGNYLIDNDYNIIYQRIPYTKEMVEKHICEMELDIGLIWPLKDGLVPNFDRVFEIICKAKNAKAIALNICEADCDPFNEDRVILSDEKIFADNLGKFIGIGGLMCTSEIWKSIAAHDCPLNDNAFESTWKKVNTLLERREPIFIVESWIYKENNGVLFNCMYLYNKCESFYTWTKDWILFLDAFPEKYAEIKYELYTGIKTYCYPFYNMWNVIYMRYTNALNKRKLKEVSEYIQKYRPPRIRMVSYISTMPRNMAKTILVNIENCRIRKIVDIYRLISLSRNDR